MAEQIKFGDKLFLKGETLILDNGENNAVIKSKNNTIIIDGNLEVSDTFTTVLSETVEIKDNLFVLNSNATGSATINAGLEVERGDDLNVQLLWDETNDQWTVGSEDMVAATFIGDLTGDVTGAHNGTVGATTPAAGSFTTVDIDAGTIDNTVIGASFPQAGTFTTLIATTLTGDLDYSNLINVPTIINHSIDTLSDVDTTTTPPTNGQTIIWDATSSQFLPGNTFSEVVEDTTPQLGGNLDLNTYDLSTTDNFATLTTSASSGTSSTVVASTETNLSNTTVAFADDTGNVQTATSAYTTLTSTEITNLGFKGEISLTYFGAAAPTSNFVWRDVSDNAEQNDMITVYTPSSDEYTFTLDHETLWQIDSTDNDVYFKQYAYGEFSITSATALTTSNTQLKDSNGFYIDPAHVTITNTGGTNYKIVFWTYDVTVGDIIEVFSPPEETVVFGWGGITTTGGRLTLLDTSGNLIYKFPVADGTTDQVLTTDGSGDLSWGTNSIVADFSSYLGGNLDTHILPDTNDTYDIGSATYKIRDLYLGSNSLHIGDVLVSTSGSNLLLDGEDVMDYANVKNKPTTLAGYGITDGGSIYSAGTGITISGSNEISLDSSGINFPSITTSDLTVTGTGSVVLASGNDLTLTAADRVKVTGTVPFKFASLTTTERNALALSEDGDMIYNSSDNIFQGYADGTWVNVPVNSFSQSDFNTAFAAKSTTDLSEGTNQYYTDARADARAQLKVDALVGGASAAFDTLVEIQNVMATDTELTSAISGLNHDTLSGFVASEHIDWTAASAGTIHASNYTDTIYTSFNTDFDTRLATKSTTDLTEGTNLYFTNERVDDRLNAMLIGGTNITVTYDDNANTLRLDAAVGGSGYDLSANDTDDLAEGSTNLYYTDARARASISATGSLSYNSGTGVISYTQGNTDTITEGSTNLYYTTARANTDFDTRLATKDTDDLAEGSLSLYYTDARARAVSIENIVEDTTPQLGGDLDLNTFDLSTTDPTVKLTTTATPSLTSGTVSVSSEINISNTTVTVNTDGDVSNAVSSYITLTSTEITNLGFKGDISLTYFGAAPITSNFVWRDVSDSAEQNDMITVYSPPTDEYTFTLPTDPTFPINSADADIYYKQYAYGEMTVTTTTTLTGSNIQLRDANGFYIDKDHVTVSSLGGNDYKIIFWSHSVVAGEIIDVLSSSTQTAIFEWGASTFSETGLVATAESFSLSSSTNDIFAMGDLEFTTGNVTGEVVGTLIYDHPTNNSIISGLTTVTIDGTGYQAALKVTDVPVIMTGNSGTANELSLVVGSATDARIWLLDSSGNLIYKLPAADGTTNQVMKTDGSGDLAWADDTDTTYTAGTNVSINGSNVISSTDTNTTYTSSDFTHDDLTGFVANEHIDWTTDQGAINLHAGNYTDTDTTYTAGTNVSISGTNVISSTDTDTTYTAGTNVSISGSNVISSTYTDTIYTSFNTDFDTRLATKSTTDLSEGTNLYYTDSRADARAQIKVDALVGGASAAFDTLVEIQNAMATDTELTSAISGLNHDALSGFVANEHIDWSAASAGTIHASNYTNTGNTTYTAGTGLTLVGTVFSNTAPDQTVSLTGTGATTVTGTYPNFTIDSTNTTTSITESIIPATDNTYDLGSTTKKYANIYGHTVEATYADIAERYATDVPYEEGTVVVFGGESEITTTTESGDVSVAGVISTNPALKLNVDAGNSQTHPYVALKGRVPCKLIGPVSKGDLIVTADNEPGYAQSIGKNDAGRSVFAKSIETDLTVGKKVIEVSIL